MNTRQLSVLVLISAAACGAAWWALRSPGPSGTGQPATRTSPSPHSTAGLAPPSAPASLHGAAQPPVHRPPPLPAPQDGLAPAIGAPTADPVALLAELAKTYAELEDPGANYEEVNRFVAGADYPEVGAVVLDRACTPAPCVMSLAWDSSGEGFDQFYQELLLSLFAAGEGVGQPSILTADQDDGTTRAWVFWSDDQASPEAQENLAQSAMIRIRAAGGPAQ